MEVNRGLDYKGQGAQILAMEEERCSSFHRRSGEIRIILQRGACSHDRA